jgi:hypothetical protein
VTGVDKTSPGWGGAKGLFVSAYNLARLYNLDCII